VVVHTFNPSTEEAEAEAEAGGLQVLASLGYIVGTCLKKKIRNKIKFSTKCFTCISLLKLHYEPMR
jgi:hypothetical protein